MELRVENMQWILINGCIERLSEPENSLFRLEGLDGYSDEP